MTKIFIEAEDKTTPEYNFLKAFVSLHFPTKDVDFICIGGIGNLFNETNKNQISQAQEVGEQALILIDADTIAKGHGFAKRKAEIDNDMQTLKLSVPYFIYPNNNDDGDVETLMESAARRDLHQVFFDCFEDYEKCVSGVMNAQKLSNKSRRKLGTGNWLFDNTNYWDLNAVTLQPLKDFLALNLK